MTLESRELITEFKHTFEVPNKDFTERSSKEINVKLIKDEVSHLKTMRGTKVGQYLFTNTYFEVTIPKFLKDFLLDRFPKYDRFEKDEVFGDKNYNDKWNRNFTSKIRNNILRCVEEFFCEMTNDALFIRELEELEKLNKVIFIYSSSNNIEKRDNYNFADLNKLVGTEFHYFVCYEREEHSYFDKVKRHYGLRRKKVTLQNNLKNNKYRNKLPYINCTNLSKYKKVKWTQEREDFLKMIEERILEISSTINDYVSKLNDNNFELIMKNKKLLESKKEEY